MKSTHPDMSLNGGLGSSLVPAPPVTLLFLPENQDLFHASLGIKYEVPSPEPTDNHDMQFVFDSNEDFIFSEQGATAQTLTEDCNNDWEPNLHEMTIVVADTCHREVVLGGDSNASVSTETSECVDARPTALPSPTFDPREDSVGTSNSEVSREFKFVAVAEGAATTRNEKGKKTNGVSEAAETIPNGNGETVAALVEPRALQLDQHWRLSKGTYKCQMCSKTSPVKSNIERHILRIHMNIKPYSCSFCHQGFCSLRAVSEHTNRVHNPSALDRRYKCKVCGKQYANEYKFRQHMNVHERKVQFKCHDCGKGFYYKHNILVHIAGRHIKSENELKHMCEYCGKSFKSSGTLRTHKRSVHRTGKQLECPLCSRTFSFQNRLERHMTQHTGERAFTCDICSKTFRIRESLRRHLQTHFDPKPHKCTVCGVCYAQKDTLDEHALKHEGIRKYSCNQCGKTFAQKSHLAAHKFVHREKSFVCTVCGAKFNRNDNMKSHLKRHFKDGADIKKENGAKNDKKNNNSGARKREVKS